MGEFTFTATLHLWWLYAYLGAGAAVVLPLAYTEWRKLARPKEPFWPWLRRNLGKRPTVIVLIVALWPVAVYQSTQ